MKLNKTTSKKLISMLSVVTVALSSLIVSSPVLAAEAGKYSVNVSLASGVTITDEEPSVTITFNDENGDEVSSGSPVEGTITADNTTFSVSPANIPEGTREVTISAEDEGLGVSAATVTIGGAQTSLSAAQVSELLSSDGISFAVTPSSSLAISFKFGGGNVVSHSPTTVYGWDRDSVYFVWADVNNTNFYYHKITGIQAAPAKTTVDVDDIVADNDSGAVFNISKQTFKGTTRALYDFVWTNGMTVALADSAFTALTPSEKLDYLKRNKMSVNPAGSRPATSNSINSAGNGSFDLTIVNTDDYKPVKISATGSTYKTEYDDELLSTETADISGTTITDPLVIKTFLLESNVTFESNDIERISVVNTALNMGSSRKGTNGKWTISFGSNFFDEVTLAIDFADRTTGFVKIVRKNLQIVEFDGNDSKHYAEICYPSSESYNDYEVIVTRVKDGERHTTVVKTPNDSLQDAAGNTRTGYEMAPAGTVGIKKAWYALPDLSGCESVYISAVKKGLSGESYRGTLQGHGSGILFREIDGKYRRILSDGSYEE